MAKKAWDQTGRAKSDSRVMRAYAKSCQKARGQDEAGQQAKRESGRKK